MTWTNDWVGYGVLYYSTHARASFGITYRASGHVTVTVAIPPRSWVEMTRARSWCDESTFGRPCPYRCHCQSPHRAGTRAIMARGPAANHAFRDVRYLPYTPWRRLLAWRATGCVVWRYAYGRRVRQIAQGGEGRRLTGKDLLIMLPCHCQCLPRLPAAAAVRT